MEINVVHQFVFSRGQNSRKGGGEVGVLFVTASTTHYTNSYCYCSMTLLIYFVTIIGDISALKKQINQRSRDFITIKVDNQATKILQEKYYHISKYKILYAYYSLTFIKSSPGPEESIWDPWRFLNFLRSSQETSKMVPSDVRTLFYSKLKNINLENDAGNESLVAEYSWSLVGRWSNKGRFITTILISLPLSKANWRNRSMW